MDIKILEINKNNGVVSVIHITVKMTLEEVKKYYDDLNDNCIYFVFNQSQPKTIIETVKHIFNHEYNQDIFDNVFCLMSHIDMEYLQIGHLNFHCSLNYNFLGLELKHSTQHTVFNTSTNSIVMRGL
ncbi:MAG: hypothetical protein ACRCW1_00545 [Anaerotignaceae bacterium]